LADVRCICCESETVGSGGVQCLVTWCGYRNSGLNGQRAHLTLSDNANWVRLMTVQRHVDSRCSVITSHHFTPSSAPPFHSTRRCIPAISSPQHLLQPLPLPLYLHHTSLAFSRAPHNAWSHHGLQWASIWSWLAIL